MDVPVKFRQNLNDLLQFEPTPWATEAMCKDMDTNIFYDAIEIPLLRAICGGCSVRTECLDYAVRNLEYGFWGGTTPDERQKIRRARKMFQKFDWRSKDQI
jgi:WhiB family redox-sensing transcriptional regulator